jgi:hypothetical protein
MVRLFLIFVILLVLNNIVYYTRANEAKGMISIRPIELEAEEVVISNRTEEFMERMAFLEGSGNPKAISKSGSYIGKYQFGKLAFEEVGHKIDIRKFKRNPSILPESKQDELFLKLCLSNKDYLSNEIGKYSGKKFKGVLVTKAGILAAAHLVGYYSVKKYLKTKGRVDRADGNGKRCSDYMREFQDIEDYEIYLKGELEKYK